MYRDIDIVSESGACFDFGMAVLPNESHKMNGLFGSVCYTDIRWTVGRYPVTSHDRTLIILSLHEPFNTRCAVYVLHERSNVRVRAYAGAGNNLRK